jgi:hypothetical protein
MVVSLQGLRNDLSLFIPRLSTEGNYIRNPIAIETRPGNRDSFPGKGQRSFLQSLQISCVHTQDNGLVGPLTRGQSGKDVRLSTPLHLLQRSRVHGAVSSDCHT